MSFHRESRPVTILRSWRPVFVLLFVLALSACMAREAVPPREPVEQPVPEGVSPLTLEQDEFLRE